jgi:ABC-type multidrug transport system fused ATPase/permease subunit
LEFCFRTFFLFNTSIRENIRFGRLDATDNEIVRAAQLADAHEFTIAFPRGYDTQVGERGLALSAGQKQRIAIARVILLDPRILILDEATSALDSETELSVHSALERVMRGRTILIIDHHLSTLDRSDSIVMLEAGNVLAVGTHEQLTQQCRQYRSLCDSLNRGRGPTWESADVK